MLVKKWDRTKKLHNLGIEFSHTSGYFKEEYHNRELACWFCYSQIMNPKIVEIQSKKQKKFMEEYFKNIV